MESTFLFKEQQFGWKNWILSVVVPITLIPVSVYLGFEIIGKSSLEQIILFCILIFNSVLCLFLIFIKLEIKVTKDEIYYRVFPFHFSTQTLSKSEVLEVESVIYNPIGEWGGWGIRKNSKGKAYNMYGNKGVEVTLKNGKIILFGSQKPDELYDAIRK
ncbi:DUF6141 family protein [Bernardetia sp. OM2101]|uniref:DUF6141 family protein n=1 Tax=Bernardetia sp. OM2101 TaxID=3344876 RepID=UPI0035CE9248